jgi:2-amino-4-hydroxy-6-hydroxymethyldihydropteridine diphosphokinase
MSELWRPAYIGIGSNLNDPAVQIGAAFERLQNLPDSQLTARSPWYRSQPMGPQNQPDFINAVAGLLTRLDAKALLEGLLGIERDMGRQRGERWGARIIDLDLLWIAGVDGEVPGLSLPHPGICERNFVLYPLADIAPTLQIPNLGVVAQLKTRVGSEGISVMESQ